MYALDAQLDVYKWIVNTPEAVRMMALLNGIDPDKGPMMTAKLLRTLEYAETFHVEREWTPFLDQATLGLVEVNPTPVLHKTELLAPTGFAYFETPLQYYMTADDRETMGFDYAPIRAIAWTPDRNITRPIWKQEVEHLPWAARMALLTQDNVGEMVDYREGEGVLIWLLVDTDWIMEVDKQMNPLHRDDAFTASQLDLFSGSPLTGFDMLSWSFDSIWTEVDYYHDRPPFTVDTSNALFRRLLYAFWHLTAQYITYTKPSRASRRRWMRELPKTPPDRLTVRHVTLRRAKGSHSDSHGEGFEYSHRFQVRGHWRNQYYPSEGVHRTIWIDPFVKGPEDKPFITKRQVFDVKR